MIKGGCLRKSLIVYIENKYKWPMVKFQFFFFFMIKTLDRSTMVFEKNCQND